MWMLKCDWASSNTLLTTAEFREIEAQQTRSFAILAAQGTTALPIALPSGLETLSVAFVSRGFFDALGTTAVHGRTIAAATDAAAAPPVALVSERLWRRAFNGELGVLETLLTIAGRLLRGHGLAARSASVRRPAPAWPPR